jgi:hypothetical protein
MLGVFERRNAKTVSTGSAAMLGEAKLVNFYNDGNKGTGTASEMALHQRQHIATEGVVVASVDVIRDPAVIAAVAAAMVAKGDGASQALASQEAASRKLKAKIRITTRAMWTDGGKLLELLHSSAETAISRLPGDAALSAVERVVGDSIRRAAKQFNNRKPEVIIIAHEADPRMGAAAGAMAKRRSSKTVRDREGTDDGEKPRARRVPVKGRRAPQGKPPNSPTKGPPKGPPPLQRLSPDVIKQRKKINPRDNPDDTNNNVEYP